jgi:hypothetical protein
MRSRPCFEVTKGTVSDNERNPAEDIAVMRWVLRGYRSELIWTQGELSCPTASRKARFLSSLAARQQSEMTLFTGNARCELTWQCTLHGELTNER